MGNRKITRRFNLVHFPYLSAIKPATPFTKMYSDLGVQTLMTLCLVPEKDDLLF